MTDWVEPCRAPAPNGPSHTHADTTSCPGTVRVRAWVAHVGSVIGVVLLTKILSCQTSGTMGEVGKSRFRDRVGQDISRCDAGIGIEPRDAPRMVMVPFEPRALIVGIKIIGLPGEGEVPGSDGLVHEAETVLSVRGPPVMGAAVADPGHMTAVQVHCRAVERLVRARYGRVERHYVSAFDRQEIGESDPDRPSLICRDDTAEVPLDRPVNMETIADSVHVIHGTCRRRKIQMGHIKISPETGRHGLSDATHIGMQHVGELSDPYSIVVEPSFRRPDHYVPSSLEFPLRRQDRGSAVSTSGAGRSGQRHKRLGRRTSRAGTGLRPRSR